MSKKPKRASRPGRTELVYRKTRRLTFSADEMKAGLERGRILDELLARELGKMHDRMVDLGHLEVVGRCVDPACGCGEPTYRLSKTGRSVLKKGKGFPKEPK